MIVIFIDAIIIIIIAVAHCARARTHTHKQTQLYRGEDSFRLYVEPTRIGGTQDEVVQLSVEI